MEDRVRLKHLYITHQGMAMGMYYILRTTDKGVYMKITNRSPDNLENVGYVSGVEAYIGFADRIMSDEYAKLLLLKEDAPLKALENAIKAAGALSWNGYSKHLSMSHVLDSGDSYRMYLEMSDGTVSVVKGYNSCPGGFMDFLYEVQEIFEAVTQHLE